MAKKRNKSGKGRNADSGSAVQASVSKPQESQVSESQAQRAKPKSSQKPKPVKAGASVQEPKQGRQAGPKATDDTRRQTQSLQKKDSNITMARGRKNKNAAPAGNRLTAKLELPEGYIPQNQQAKANKSRKRPQKAKEPATMSPPMPWELNPKYPKPLDDCHFNYNRFWHSLGDNPRHGMAKYLARHDFMSLQRPRPGMTKAELETLHDVYWDAGEPELYTIRHAAMGKPFSPKIFRAFPMASADGMSDANDGVPLLSRLMRSQELTQMVLDLLSPSICDLTALAATCKRAANLVRESFEFWDFQTGSFPKDRFVERRADDGRVIQGGGIRANTLVISPVSDEPKPIQHAYAADFKHMKKLCATITKIPCSFRSLVLDQIPFLNVDLFELMVATMPNLEEVAITRCVMLDVTKLKPLLKVIERHPRTLKNGETSYIRLDFFPFFFRGPEDSATRLGSYGVTWNEPTFHSPKAVFGLIMQCQALATLVGMDLLSESSAFWRFVRQLPGPDALWAMKAREALVAYNSRRKQGRPSEPMKRIIKDDFADDLTAAVTGDNSGHIQPTDQMLRYYPDRDRFDGWYWRNWDTCHGCEFTYPRSLFIHRLTSCWACKMDQYVNTMEDSHLRFWQSSALRLWLGDLPVTESKLRHLLRGKEAAETALEEAKKADFVRDYFLNGIKKLDDGSTYFPPPPKTLDAIVTSLTHWRWSRCTANQPFDYRQGGPQHEDPCKNPLISAVESVDQKKEEEVEGAENRESFLRRWEWTEATDAVFVRERSAWHYARRTPLSRDNSRMDINHPTIKRELERAKKDPRKHWTYMIKERLQQIKADRETYRWHRARVQDCRFSMATPRKLPFNSDEPFPDPGLNKEAFEALMALHVLDVDYYDDARPQFV